MPSNVYLRILWILFTTLVLLSCARAVLYLSYPGEFTSLSAGDIAFAFVHGVRFDASVVATFLGLPLLLLLLPFRWARRPLWQGLWLWLIYGLLLVLALMVVIDAIYFGVVHRHAGPEVTILTGDPALLIELTLRDYWQAVVLFVLVGVGGAMVWRRLIAAHLSPPQRTLPHVAAMIAVFAVLVLVGRGGLQYKPVSIVNAFSSGPVAAGYLTLNGPFSIAHSALSSQPAKLEFMPWAEAVAEARAVLFAPNETPEGDQFPLMRHAAGKLGLKPNIVVFMLESWDAIHIDALRRRKGLEPLGVTPNFDALVAQGVLFERFYATGQRSVDGMAALLASMPTLPGMPYIGKGLEQGGLAFMGSLARSQGYQTIFLQSSNRGSFRVDAIAARAGFDVYLGAEDIPSADAQQGEKNDWGVWDHDTFQAANRLFASSGRPFLGFVFSSTTHQPWHIPNETWRKYPGDSARDRYLNTLYYADWALGRFMAAAKQGGYYDDTIFIFTADHVSQIEVDPQDIATLYHIPLLVVGPGLTPRVDARVGSQLDVLPSIIHLAQWDVTHASLGRSLFDTAAQHRGTFSVNWQSIDRIEETGWLSHNLTRRVGAHIIGPIKQADAMERRLLALYQTTVALALENRLYRETQGR